MNWPVRHQWCLLGIGGLPEMAEGQGFQAGIRRALESEVHTEQRGDQFVSDPDTSLRSEDLAAQAPDV